VLAALWGASFLFMRVAADDFGPAALAWLRVAIAAAVLLPLLCWRGGLAAARAPWRAIAVVGLLGSALPFVAYGYAALALPAGLLAIFNATVPMWGALIAWAWLSERLGGLRALGLGLGFGGVLALGWDQAAPAAGSGELAVAAAVLACLLATVLYGYSANYTRQRLVGVAPLAVAAGSQLAAALWLAPLALPAWPATPPPLQAWAAVLALGVLSTGLAYLLYFRLIAQAGAAQAMSVTYLIPVFGVFWGWALLGEPVTAAMVAAGAVILAGTALVVRRTHR
jgi:drug/metabolite transporter (DMT)-like permease